MFAVERFGGAIFGNAFIQFMPPVVAAGLHVDSPARAPEHDDVPHAGAIGHRLVHGVL